MKILGPFELLTSAKTPVSTYFWCSNTKVYYTQTSLSFASIYLVLRENCHDDKIVWYKHYSM